MLYSNDEKGSWRKTLNFKARTTAEVTYPLKHIKYDKHFKCQQEEMRVAKSKAVIPAPRRQRYVDLCEFKKAWSETTTTKQKNKKIKTSK